MGNVNKVFLLGNLTRDPELRYTSGGSAVCNLSIATNRKYKTDRGTKEETTFHRIVVWGKQGESCGQYLRKGRSIHVEGRLQSRSWETDDGQKRSTIEVVAEDVQFLGGGGSRRSQSDDVGF